LAIWTLLAVASLAWNLSLENRHLQDMLMDKSRTHIQKDMAVRIWAARHGGLYVPVDKRTPPNTYLAHVPERDIATPSGKLLTLMNPAYMLRQLNEESATGVISGHITSLKVLRPENAPDDWERKALLQLEEGHPEVTSFSEIGDVSWLRLMLPLHIENEGCLKCHGHQGYEVGDLRGGISASVSMVPYLAMSRGLKQALFLSHALIWLLGTGGIGLFHHRAAKRASERWETEKERQQDVQALRKANRVLRMLRDCNQALVHAADETVLLDRICRNIIEIGGYRLAWVGFAEEDEEGSVRPVAQAGMEAGYLEGLRISWRDCERGRGPTGTALRTGRPCPITNIPTDPRFVPWRAEALKRGYASCVGLPLTCGGKTFGALSIYAPEPDAFDPDEIGLLVELADDLAYGIQSRRTELAHRQASAALNERVKELSCIFAITDLVHNSEFPMEEILQRVAEAIPPAFQFPEVTCARVTIGGRAFLSENFSETSWRLASEVSNSIPRGRVEVFYREEKPLAAEGPFLAEERHLLDDVARRLENFLHRRETAETLRATRLRLQHLLTVSPGVLFSAVATEPPFRTNFVSDNVKLLTGYQPEQFLEDPDFWFDRIHPEDRPSVQELFESLSPGQALAREYRFRCKDGSWRWMLDSCRLLADAEGKPAELVGSWVDITEHKLSEQELERLNKTLRVISRCNEALVRATSEQELLETILRHLVETGDYALALTWLFEENEETFALAVYPEEGAGFLRGEDENSCGIIRHLSQICRQPFSREIPLSESIIFRDACCRELVDTFDIRSGFSLTLGSKEENFGCLVLFSSAEGFRSQEIYLLKELADDLAYGIGSLRIEKAHRQAQEMLRLRNRAIEASVNGIMISENRLPEMPMIYVNPAFERITGYRAEEALGRGAQLLVGREFGQKGWADIRAALRAGRPETALVRNYRKDGSLFWNDLSIAPVRNDAEEVTHFVSIINDVSDRKQYEEELARKSNFDELTGLANRNLLQDRIEQAIAHALRNNERLALFLLDLDRFQVINDSLGHSLGNELLKRVSERLETCIRSQDTLARLGGDEFVTLFLEVKDREGLIEMAQRIRKALAPPFTIGKREIQITTSIGISLFPQDGEEGELLLRNAELALSRAKEEGRDTFQFFAPEMDLRALETMDLEADLRRALERKEFLLHFQPKVDVAGGRIVGSEALVRWQHPERGLVSPGAFIPLAEETGLIEPLGIWVLREACRRNKAFQDQGLPLLPVAVNISARQFRNEKLVELVKEVLEESGLEPRWLELELTESMVMDKPEQAAELMTRLKRLGVSLSLDDFGTSYSSLNYLRRFPVDRLKVDRTFISDVAVDPGAAAVAESVVAIAHNLKIEAVAEGVENEEQLAFLRSCNCDVYQGFLFSQPLPADQFIDLLRKKFEGSAS
jgi:diguanylate cyclase (GGDEF)-like protein/PAS domain S-box-containing protein